MALPPQSMRVTVRREDCSHGKYSQSVRTLMFRYGRTPRTGDGKLGACGRGDLVPPLCAISVWRMFVSSLETQSICSLHRYRNLHIPPTTSYWIHCNARILSASNHSRPLLPRLTLFTKRQRQLPWGVANLHHNTDQLTSSGQQH